MFVARRGTCVRGAYVAPGVTTVGRRCSQTRDHSKVVPRTLFTRPTSTIDGRHFLGTKRVTGSESPPKSDAAFVSSTLDGAHSKNIGTTSAQYLRIESRRLSISYEIKGGVFARI